MSNATLDDTRGHDARTDDAPGTLGLFQDNDADIDFGAISKMWVDTDTGEVLDATRALMVVEREIAGMPGTPTRDYLMSLVVASQLALKEIKNAGDAKVLGDRIGDIEILLKRRGAALAESNLISAQRLRTERYTGELLSVTVSRGNPNLTGGRTLPANINRNQSSNWQHMAEIPESFFEQWLQEMITAEQEITTGAAMDVYYKYVRPSPPPPSNEDAANMPDPGDTKDYSANLMYRCPHCGQDIHPDTLIRIVNDEDEDASFE